MPLPPLALPEPDSPPDPEALLAYPALALFVERARALKPGFHLSADNAAAVAALCARLDGLPLAIELAAAQVKRFSPQAMLARFAEATPLELFSAGPKDAPVRQQTLRATIAWSYALLSAKEQQLFRCLTVFVGGRTLAAVEAVCADADDQDEVSQGLESLLDKNLLREDLIEGEQRYFMLKIIRDYALERLKERGEAEAVRRAHAVYYLTLAQEAEPQLTGPTQLAWLDRLEREHNNLRVALGWALACAPELGLRLAGTLWRFWHTRGHYSEGRRWLEATLARATGAGQARAQALSGLGVLHHQQDDYEQASRLLEEALALWRSLGNEKEMAATLNHLAAVAQFQHDDARAVRLREESLSLPGSQWNTASALYGLGALALKRQDYGEATSRLKESLALFRQWGAPVDTAAVVATLGQVAERQHHYAEAEAHYREGLHLYRQFDHKHGVLWTLDMLASLALRQGENERARATRREHLALAWQLGSKLGITL